MLRRLTRLVGWNAIVGELNVDVLRISISPSNPRATRLTCKQRRPVSKASDMIEVVIAPGFSCNG